MTTVTLYDCYNLASGCSECIAARIGSEFACGWCGGSCVVRQECSNSFVIKGDNCPAPVINSFTPISGKSNMFTTSIDDNYHYIDDHCSSL